MYIQYAGMKFITNYRKIYFVKTLLINIWMNFFFFKLGLVNDKVWPRRRQ